LLDSLTLSPGLKTSLNEATGRYEMFLPEALSYLEARGIDQDVATGHRLGVVYDPIAGHERFEGWLCIPYVTSGGVVGLKFRCIEDHDCKAVKCQRYDSPSGQKARLYNAQSLADGGSVVVVVEGEIGAIIAQSALSVPCVGTPGASAWEPWWPRCFSDFDRVIVVADHDAKEDGSDPGRKHAEKVRKSIEGAELVLPPAGMDLDEWIQSDGVDAVKKAMGLS
jgi:hypothetical protein